MRQLIKYLLSYPRALILYVALLCSITFIVNFIGVFKDFTLERHIIHQLLSYADAFETVAMILLMIALRDKKK